MAPPIGRVGRAAAEKMGQILPFRRPGAKDKLAERPVPSPDSEGLRPPKTQSDAQTIRMNHWTDRMFDRFAELSRWLNTRFPQTPAKSDYVFYPATAEPVKGEPWPRGVASGTVDAVEAAAETVKGGNEW